MEKFNSELYNVTEGTLPGSMEESANLENHWKDGGIDPEAVAKYSWLQDNPDFENYFGKVPEGKEPFDIMILRVFTKSDENDEIALYAVEKMLTYPLDFKKAGRLYGAAVTEDQKDRAFDKVMQFIRTTDDVKYFKKTFTFRRKRDRKIFEEHAGKLLEITINKGGE